MRKTLLGAAILAGGLTGCQMDHANPAGGQVVDLTAGTRLVVSTEGAETKPAHATYVPVGKSRPGQAIHRVIEDAGGQPVFAYDFVYKAAPAGGGYIFTLAPASGNVPTFASSRNVTVAPAKEAVRVELMEQPETGKKIADIFRLIKIEGEAPHPMSISEHLMALHNRFYHWAHGE